MTKGRLEAFSDGVIAIIITIMVLELRPTEGTRLENLEPLIPPSPVACSRLPFRSPWWRRSSRC